MSSLSRDQRQANTPDRSQEDNQPRWRFRCHQQNETGNCQGKTAQIADDPPYGTERSFNGLRMAHALAKHDPAGDVTVFLMADAVLCAKAGQKTPEGFYNVERMLGRVLSAKGRVLMCGTCMDARGLTVGDMIEAAARSTMDELAEATLAANKVLVFGWPEC